MRFGFVTCVELGLSCMRQIYAAGGHLDLAVTLKDEIGRKKSGRIYLDEFCEQHGVPLAKIRHINEPSTIQLLREAELDWLFIIGWSQVAGQRVLDVTRQGALGMHPTLLPQGRGRAAIPWAILKGLPETGVTLFKLDHGIDSGPIIDQVRLPVAEDETASSLYSRVAKAHRRLIERNWTQLESGTVDLKQQNESEATYWPGRTPEDGRIHADLTVDQTDRLVRATTRPYPGAFIDLDHHRLRIWGGRPTHQGTCGPGITVKLRDGWFLATDFEKEELPLEANRPHIKKKKQPGLGREDRE